MGVVFVKRVLHCALILSLLFLPTSSPATSSPATPSPVSSKTIEKHQDKHDIKPINNHVLTTPQRVGHALMVPFSTVLPTQGDRVW